MTNSSTSSQNRPKLIIIHGLNNNSHAFQEMESALQEKGFSTLRITLPGHGEDRSGPLSFHSLIKDVVKDPYMVIAFSTGALYFENWLHENAVRPPKAKIYLAPAFYLRHERVLRLLMKLLPSSFAIRSFSPKEIQRYPSLYVHEYQSFFARVKQFKTYSDPYPERTLVIVDEDDELVHAKKLERESKRRGAQVWTISRHYLTTIGTHHILFSSKYWKKKEWDEFIEKVSEFFNAEV